MASLSTLERRLNNISLGIAVNANNAVGDTAFEIARVLILNTPRATGQARRNWRSSVNVPITDTTKETDYNGQSTVRRVLGVAAKRKSGEPIYITNNLPYIVPLNNGHSEQAPAGFVQRAVRTGERAIKRVRLVKK